MEIRPEQSIADARSGQSNQSTTPPASDAGSLSDATSSSTSGGGRGTGLPLRLPLGATRRQAWCDVEDDHHEETSVMPAQADEQCTPPSRRNLLRYDRRRRQREEKRQSPRLLTQAPPRSSPKVHNTKQQQLELGTLPLTPPPPPDYSPKLAATNTASGFMPPACAPGIAEGGSVRQQPIIMSTSPVSARTPQHPAGSLGFFPAPAGAATCFQTPTGWSLSAALGMAEPRRPPEFLPMPVPTPPLEAHIGARDASSRQAAIPPGCWPERSLGMPSAMPAASPGSLKAALLTPLGSSDRAELAARLLAAAPESYED